MSLMLNEELPEPTFFDEPVGVRSSAVSAEAVDGRAA
jgi:hypothetical protein